MRLMLESSVLIEMAGLAPYPIANPGQLNFCPWQERTLIRPTVFESSVLIGVLP